MKKNAVWIIAILAVSIIAIFYIWSSHNRYYIINSSKGQAYEVDRKTGKTWVLTGGRKVEQKTPVYSDLQEKAFPYDQKSKVTGNAGLSGFGSFSGRIYNGSGWTVTRVVVNVKALEEDGSERWNRDFSANIKISPLKTEYFSVTVTGDHGNPNAKWYIKEIYGYNK